MAVFPGIPLSALFGGASMPNPGASMPQQVALFCKACGRPLSIASQESRQDGSGFPVVKLLVDPCPCRGGFDGAVQAEDAVYEVVEGDV